MDHRSRFSTLNAQYEDFLYAPVCEEANGMRLSVISALARMNVDPWEEATRLAAMPKAIAEKTLVSILDLVCGRSWQPPEAQAIAARLVRLLPQQGQAAAMTATGNAKGTAQPTSYWWVWVGLALAMSFLTPQHQTATTNPGLAASDSIAASQLKSNPLAPGAVGQSR